MFHASATQGGDGTESGTTLVIPALISPTARKLGATCASRTPPAAVPGVTPAPLRVCEQLQRGPSLFVMHVTAGQSEGR